VEPHALDISDLVGLEYGTGPNELRCWELAVEVLRRLKVSWPRDQAAAMAAEQSLAVEVAPSEPCRAGDVLVMDGRQGLHVAVCIGSTRAIHAYSQGTVRVDRIVALLETGTVQRRVRPRELCR
jgi:cell wall-associated NlpC family hydrolase